MFQALTLSPSSGCAGGLVEPELMTIITVRQICGITLYMNIKLYIIVKQTIPLRHVFFWCHAAYFGSCVAMPWGSSSVPSSSVKRYKKNARQQVATLLYIEHGVGGDWFLGHSSWTEWPLKMGLICYPEMLVNNYRHTLRNMPDEWRSQPNRGESLKLCQLLPLKQCLAKILPIQDHLIKITEVLVNFQMSRGLRAGSPNRRNLMLKGIGIFFQSQQTS